jgi:hypothetical protein
MVSEAGGLPGWTKDQEGIDFPNLEAECHDPIQVQMDACCEGECATTDALEFVTNPDER